MKTDDFEEQLKQQPLRKVPPEWCDQLLERALQEAERAPMPIRELSGLCGAVNFWREWLWPSPKAWAALACIWILLCILHLGFPGVDPSNARGGGIVELSDEHLQALKEQRLLQAELMRMTDNNSPTPSSAPKPRTKIEGSYIFAMS